LAGDDSNSLLAGNFFAPQSTLCAIKSCNVMALPDLQSAGCGLERARNREFPATETGKEQARSERIRERTGGENEGARPGATGL
jgi:hypothetical protein